MMKEELDDQEFEKIFRNRFENFKATPPKNAWENIIVQAPKQSFYKRKWFFFFCNTILLLGISIYVFYPGKSNVFSSLVDMSGNNPTVREFQKPELVSSQGLPEKALTQSPEDSSPFRTPAVLEQERPQKEEKNTPQESTEVKPVIPGVSDTQTQETKVQKKRKKQLSNSLGTTLLPGYNSTSFRKKRENNTTPGLETLNTDTNLTNTIFAIQTIASQPSLPLPVSVSNIPVDTPERVEQTVPKKRRHTYIQAFIAPIYTSQKIQPNQDDSTVITDVQQSNDIRKNTGVHLGISMDQEITNRFRVFFGGTYEVLKNDLRYEYFSSVPSQYNTISNNRLFIVVEPEFQRLEEQISSTFRSWSVQTGAKYMLVRGRYAQHIRLGVGYNEVMSVKHHGDIQEGTQLLKNTNGQISLLLGYEMSYRMHDKLVFHIEPHINYYFNSLYSGNATYQLQPYIVGLRLGLGWKVR